MGTDSTLDVSSLHLAAGSAYIEYIRKAGKLTYDTLPLETLLTLREYIGSRTEGPMFLNNYGQRITRHNVASIIDRVAKAAGVDPYGADGHRSPHSVRRAFATIYRQCGGSASELQDALHHTDPRTTAWYDRRKDSGGAAARLKVAELLSA